MCSHGSLKSSSNSRQDRSITGTELSAVSDIILLISSFFSIKWCQLHFTGHYVHYCLIQSFYCQLTLQEKQEMRFSCTECGLGLRCMSPDFYQSCFGVFLSRHIQHSFLCVSGSLFSALVAVQTW